MRKSSNLTTIMLHWLRYYYLIIYTNYQGLITLFDSNTARTCISERQRFQNNHDIEQIDMLSALQVLTRDELQTITTNTLKSRSRFFLVSRIAITYWTSSLEVYKLMAFDRFSKKTMLCYQCDILK